MCYYNFGSIYFILSGTHIANSSIFPVTEALLWKIFWFVQERKMTRDRPHNCEEMDKIKKKAGGSEKFDEAYAKDKAAKSSAALPEKASADDKDRANCHNIWAAVQFCCKFLCVE